MGEGVPLTIIEEKQTSQRLPMDSNVTLNCQSFPLNVSIWVSQFADNCLGCHKVVSSPNHQTDVLSLISFFTFFVRQQQHWRRGTVLEWFAVWGALPVPIQVYNSHLGGIRYILTKIFNQYQTRMAICCPPSRGTLCQYLPRVIKCSLSCPRMLAFGHPYGHALVPMWSPSSY